MLFKTAQKLTIISINELLGNTQHREIQLTREVDGRQAYKVKGKRKEYFLKLDHTELVFDGWGLQVQVDSNCTHGTYNFITNKPMELKALLTSKNINELFNRWFMVMWDESKRPPNLFTPLFTVSDMEGMP